MMVNKSIESLKVSETNEYLSVVLPYKGDDLEMMLIMPTLGTFTAFESTFDATKLNEIDSNLRNYFSEMEMELYLPKFRLETKKDLFELLSNMGLSSLQNNDYSLAPLLGTEYGSSPINRILHNAVIIVNEQGTEAAAVTSVDANNCSPPSFVFDHPFIYIIRDSSTKSILFMGRYTGKI